ncbi:type VI secretion system accessory protein TagV [Gibbsiella quercinecans]|uniref:type VI secretion system accessory protein TagV n=1 Tax=Gibbsiella quercinecans TaxID=929813 RepID=UPI000EF1C0C9|nr:type VI secretion system accessory protein TagV [Gibbsiella quercinecans]RLM12477.1 hypothetical protein BIY27_11945 [Gibbsiella quercinecans]
MKTRITMTLFVSLLLAGCSSPPPPPPVVINNDALVTSEVNGVTLQHRAAVSAPTQFKPINEPYRSLYAASVMSQPDYHGEPISQLGSAAPFFVLGEAQNHWLAISNAHGGELQGYVQGNAGVPEKQYKATLRKDLPRRAASRKPDCVKIGGDSQACKDAASATWIMQ